MKEKNKSLLKGLRAFKVLYFVSIIVVVKNLIGYLQWTFQLVKKWALPEEAFFSNIELTGTEGQISITSYLIVAICYIVFYAFIPVGLIRLERTLRLLSENKLFLKEIIIDFQKAGRFFLVFFVGTFATDILLLLIASTGRPVLSLFSTDNVVFFILAYLLFFLSDILKQGIVLKEENELTI